MDAEDVFERVQACMANLVGGSGHLVGYALRRDSFEVEGHRELADGLTEYAFAVEGVRVSEFDGPAAGANRSGFDDLETGADRSEFDGPAAGGDRGADVEHLAGTVVLDGGGNLALDGTGRVRIAPWRTADPAFWLDADDGGIEALLSELDPDHGSG